MDQYPLQEQAINMACVARSVGLRAEADALDFYAATGKVEDETILQALERFNTRVAESAFASTPRGDLSIRTFQNHCRAILERNKQKGQMS